MYCKLKASTLKKSNRDGKEHWIQKQAEKEKEQMRQTENIQ